MTPTKTTGPVRLNPPPPGLMRLLNPVVRRLLITPPTARRVPKLALIEVRGRRSDRLLRIPVGLHDIDEAPTAFTCRRWRLNFAGGAPVTVFHRGERHAGRGVLVTPNPGQVGTALRTALDEGASPFDLGLKIDRRHRPTEAELDAAGLSMIRFHLAPLDGAPS